MNEGRTTAIFGVVAAIALGLAWWSKPETISSEADFRRERVGQDVFPSFADPDGAASMEIVKYDEELAQLKRFEVARDNTSKLWKLPSNDDYPADAADQVRDATTPLIGLKVLSVESDLISDHELYGVVNPDDEELAAGTSGVGMLVRLKDSANQVLASLIIGKEVKQAEGQRYARIPTEDAVYKVEIDTKVFTTEFRDWIEGELLGVQSFDITRIGVRDYELQQQSLTAMALKRNFDAQVDYDNSTSKWSLNNMQSYEGLNPIPVTLAEDEELNTDFLNKLRTAVQELEIVDVKRKPVGLVADLKADEALLQNQDSVTSLQRQGFYPAGGPDGTEIYAAGGETIIGTEAGVDYVLRFGEATASLSSVGSGDSEDGGLSRYLLVTARMNESIFPAPELEPLPETVEEMLAREKVEQPETATPVAPEVSDANPPTEPNETEPAAVEKTPASAEMPNADPAASEPKANETEAAKSTNEGDVGTAETPATETPAANESATPTESTGTEGVKAPPAEGTSTGEPPKGSEPTADPEEPQEETVRPPAPKSETVEGESKEITSETQESKSVEPTNSDGKQNASETPAESVDSKQTVDTPPAAEEPIAKEPATPPVSEEMKPQEDMQEAKPQETEEELKERLEFVRSEIAKENQRKIDDRKEKMDEARKQVQELNARFSDWYYVVSESVYKKLKITREDLVKSSTGSGAAAPNFGAGVPGLNGISLPPQP